MYPLPPLCLLGVGGALASSRSAHTTFESPHPKRLQCGLMRRTRAGIQADFARQVTSVHQLLEFDTLVLDHLVGGIGGIAERLEKQSHNIAANDVRNRLSALKQIRSASSLRGSYQTIFNQCVVLLVSYFGATVGDLFRTAVESSLASGVDVPVTKQEIAFSWLTLRKSDVSLEEMIAGRIVSDQKISFQDMGGIAKAFDDNLGIRIEANEDRNDVILGQAARHVIVHTGGVIDRKMVNQVKNCVPRRLKQSLELGQGIQFDPEEVKLLGRSMHSYVEHISSKTAALLPDISTT